MSVYTPLNHPQLTQILSRFLFWQSDKLINFKAILDGIENTNYRLFTEEQLSGVVDFYTAFLGIPPAASKTA